MTRRTPSPHGPPAEPRGRWLLWLRLGVSLLFLGVVAAAAWKTRGQWRLGFHGLGWLALGVLPGLASVGLKSWKWLVALRPLYPEVGFGQALRSYLGGIPLSVLTPGRVGELSRLVFLERPELVSWRGAGSLVVDKLSDLAALVWWLALGMWLAGPGWLGLVLGGVALALSPLGWWLRVAPGLVARLPLPARWRERLGDMVPAPGDYPPWRVWALLGLGLASFGVEWVQYWALFNALAPAGTGVTLAETLAAMSLATVANLAQISFAGLGVREGLAALLLWERISAAAAAVGSFLVFLCDVALPGVVGLCLRPSLPGARQPADPVVHSQGVGD